MILDTSVIVAVVCQEEGYLQYVEQMQEASALAVGAPTLTEAGIVLQARLGGDGRAILERFVADFEVRELTFGGSHWRGAVDAHRRFGKGRHPAALNFGDCLTYASARLAGEPLLAVGNDFARTDLELA